MAAPLMDVTVSLRFKNYMDDFKLSKAVHEGNL